MSSWTRRALAVGTLLVLRAPATHAVDCNQNRVEDLIDVETGASPDCNRNLVPDECDVLPVSYGLALDREVPLDLSAMLVLARDFDGDGSPDVALLLEFGTAITLLWNDGGGGFGERTNLNLTQESFSGLLEPLDLEGDGDLDLISIAFDGSLFQNDGDRAFSRGPRFRLDFPARAVAPGDLDLDGDADLAVAGPFEVVIFHQVSDGAFEESEAFPIGSSPDAIAAADLDGDDDLDLATGNSLGNVSILLNRGAGLFTRPRNYATGGATRRLEATDMDGDGDTDLVTIFPVAAGGHAVLVLENAGDGSFEAGTPVPIVIEAVAILPDDVDGDGDLDLILPSTWIAFVQNHGGVLAPAELFPGEIDPRSAVAADLDGDGSLDIVETQFNPRISVLERVPWQNRADCNRDGVPDDCQLAGNDCNENSVPDDCDVASGASHDCDANGTPDECQPDCNENAVPDDCDLARGTSADCNGNSIPDECDLLPHVHVEPARELDRIAVHGPLHVADLDGDRDLDLVTTVESLAIRSFLNLGNGDFEAAADQALDRRGAIVLVADLEGDGDPDLVLRGPGFIVMTNDGKGRFEGGAGVDSGSSVFAGADLDGDGDLDLVVGGSQTGARAHLFTGKEFEAASVLVRDQSIGSLVTGDFDSDGDVDVAGVLRDAGVIRTFLNDGVAGFPSSRDSPGGNIDSAFTAVDLDGDGDLDLAEWSRNRGPFLGVHLNEGDGRFAETVPILLSRFAAALAAADLDGDGDADLAVGTGVNDLINCAPASALTFLVNDGSASFASFQGPLVEQLSVPSAVVAGDLDGDGLDDVAMLAFPDCPCCIGPTQSSIHVILNRTIAAASRDGNRNELPDECEGPPFRRGDSSGDGRFDITDAVTVLLHLFRGGPEPTCASSTDSNDDAKVDIADPIHFLVWLFAGGPPPPHPGAACGHDPDPPGTEGNLGCAAYEGC